MEKSTSPFKNILEQQGGKCECGNQIMPRQAKFLVNTDGNPVAAICFVCAVKFDKERMERGERLVKEKMESERKKERENWLDPNNPDYDSRLRCSNEGHRVVGSSQGFTGGGCWCGYFSPEEKPLRTNEGELW